jgi:hypothetical protein
MTHGGLGLGLAEGSGSAGFDGFRFWVLSSVSFSSNDHWKSDLLWSIPPQVLHLPISLTILPSPISDLSGLTLPLQLSLSLFFSSLGSLGLRREERRKNRKGEERRREGRN